ncbi:MAG: alpha/beta family hydrolase [Terriglobales bacterium]
MPAEAFSNSDETPAVRGFLHRPAEPSGDGLVLTHGAGGNCNAPLLIALAEKFADAGWTVLRCDLPSRQLRATGPPRGNGSEDREGLRRAPQVLRKIVSGRIFLGGQSYGGRQATILAAAEPGLADGLLLLSYPLHPPGKPAQLRTAHLPKIKTPSLFVSGSKDPFGSPQEIQFALKLIPASVEFLLIEGAGHDLGFGRRVRNGMEDVPERIVRAFLAATSS